MSLFEFALAAVHLVAYSDSSTGMCGVSVAVAIFCIMQLWQAALCPSKLWQLLAVPAVHPTAASAKTTASACAWISSELLSARLALVW